MSSHVGAATHTHAYTHTRTPVTGGTICPKTLQRLSKACCAHACALAAQGQHHGVAAAAVQHIALITQVGSWPRLFVLRLGACLSGLGAAMLAGPPHLNGEH